MARKWTRCYVVHSPRWLGLTAATLSSFIQLIQQQIALQEKRTINDDSQLYIKKGGT